MSIKDFKMIKDVKEECSEQLNIIKKSNAFKVFWINGIAAVIQPVLLGLVTMILALQLGFGLFGIDYESIESIILNSFDYQYMESTLGLALGTIMIFLIIMLIFAIFVGILMPNANLNSFKLAIAEKQEITVGSYFKNMFKGLGRYIGYWLLYVFLPSVGLVIVGTLLGLIPFISFNLDPIWSGIYAVLYFRCCLKLFRVDSKTIMNNEWKSWLAIAIVGIVSEVVIGNGFAVIIVGVLVEFQASFIANKYEPNIYKHYNLNVHEMYAKTVEDKKELVQEEEEVKTEKHTVEEEAEVKTEEHTVEAEEETLEQDKEE
ncbi:hypothetical protein UT300012_21910 [Paraclostridium bifermentans]